MLLEFAFLMGVLSLILIIVGRYVKYYPLRVIGGALFIIAGMWMVSEPTTYGIGEYTTETINNTYECINCSCAAVQSTSCGPVLSLSEINTNMTIQYGPLPDVPYSDVITLDVLLALVFILSGITTLLIDLLEFDRFKGEENKIEAFKVTKI